MYIKKVRIQNFKAYGGCSEIAFPETKNALFIVKGENRYGKTSFFQALSWCLYGRLRKGYSAEFRYELENLKHLGSKEPMFVEMFFEHNNEDYNIRREAKIEGGRLVSTVKLSKGGAALCADESDVRDVISGIVPEDIHSFFFFDGEEVKEIMETQESELIRTSIEKLVGLSFVADAANDLAIVKSDLESEWATALRQERSSAKFSEEFGAAKLSLAEHEDKVKEDRGKLAELTSQLEQVEIELEKAGDKRIAEALEKLNGLRSEKEKWEKKASEAKENLNKAILTAPFFILRENIENAIAKVEGDIKAFQEKTDQEYARILLEKSIKNNKGRCLVCGLTIPDAGKSPNTAVKATKMGSLLADKQRVRGFLESIRGANTDFISPAVLEEEIRTLTLKIKGLETDCRDTSKLMDVEKTVSIQLDAMKKRRTDLENDIAEVRKKIGADESYVDDIKDGVAELRGKLSRVESKVKGRVGATEIEQQMDIAEGLMRVFEEFRRAARLLRRTKILDGTWEIFKKLTQDVKSYSRFDYKSEDDYSIQAFNQAGQTVFMKGISDGEKQALVLSTILGINQYTPFKAPIVADSPLHRLDKSFREGLIKTLAELPNQVILFLLPQDHEEVTGLCAQHISKTFTIKRDFEKYCSSIGE